MNIATLALDDGTLLYGNAFGAAADSVFELVFNTSMTGYQEILSDPSYRGQAVVFTAPHIGNTGINGEDGEAATPQVAAAVVHALSPVESSWRSQMSLSDWLEEHGIPGISGIDTRFLTRKLRDQGTLKAALTTKGTDADVLLRSAHTWEGLDKRDMVKACSCERPFVWTGDGGSRWILNKSRTARRIVLYDFGAKRNIMRNLAPRASEVIVVPADFSAEKTLALEPDGIMLSNGPGDPAGLPYIVPTVRRLIESKVPIFGICLGHQLIGRALGGNTLRLKFGHHGGNHPVKCLSDGSVLITAQNHNYVVDPETLASQEVVTTHYSLNDNTLEGMRLKNYPVFSVQFHPEGAPGPHDALDIFEEFFDLVAARKDAR